MTPIERAVEIVGGPAKLAAILGKSTQAVCFWRDGKRKLPAEMCLRIERATDGQVTRRDLRPADYAEIWPDLIAADSAEPAVDKPLALVERRVADHPVEIERRVNAQGSARP